MANQNAGIDNNRIKTLLGITDDANAEVRRLLVDATTGRLKVSANIAGLGSTSNSTGTTSNATATKVGAVSTTAGTVYYVEVRVLAEEDAESDRAVFHISGLFHRPTGGNITRQGLDNAINITRSDSNWSVTLNPNTTSQEIEVLCTGAAGTDINWSTNINYYTL